MDESVYWPLSVLWREGPSGTKVQRLNICRSILSCGVITHSVKETGQQKGQCEWGLEVTGILWGGLAKT